MKAKEKAKELVDMFIPQTRVFHETLGWEDYIDSAKQCAIIAVDEIISVIENGNPIESQWVYWQEVKQEINNL